MIIIISFLKEPLFEISICTLIFSTAYCTVHCFPFSTCTYPSSGNFITTLKTAYLINIDINLNVNLYLLVCIFCHIFLFLLTIVNYTFAGLDYMTLKVKFQDTLLNIPFLYHMEGLLIFI